jgi:hypothetical protein
MTESDATSIVKLGKALKKVLKEIIVQTQAWIDEEAGTGKSSKVGRKTSQPRQAQEGARL